MQIALEDFFEWFVLSVAWTHERNLIVHVEDAPTSRSGELVFHKVVYFRALSSRLSEITQDNEIWKFEEVKESALLNDVFEEGGIHWLRQIFVGDSLIQTTFEPADLHHIVLFSDYLDFEWLCVDYEVTVTNN